MAPHHGTCTYPSFFLVKWALHCSERTDTSSSYLFWTELIFPNVSDYTRVISLACWPALIFPFLGQKEQTNRRFGYFVALWGHSLTAIGNEAAHPWAFPSLLFPVDVITLHTQMQMTSQSMPKCPEVCIILSLQKFYF